MSFVFVFVLFNFLYVEHKAFKQREVTNKDLPATTTQPPTPLTAKPQPQAVIPKQRYGFTAPNGEIIEIEIIPTVDHDMYYSILNYFGAHAITKKADHSTKILSIEDVYEDETVSPQCINTKVIRLKYSIQSKYAAKQNNNTSLGYACLENYPNRNKYIDEALLSSGLKNRIYESY